MPVLLLVACCSFGQTGNRAARPSATANVLKTLKGNRLVVGQQHIPTASVSAILSKPTSSISVSGSMISEVGHSIAEVYNINNKVVGLRLQDRNHRGLSVTSNAGLKGWEAKAVGRYADRPGSTIAIQYRYSLEDLILNGMGHSVKMVKKF